LRHPNQATARERVKRPLAEPTQAGNRTSAASDNDLVPPLHPLQVLAEAIMELTDPDFALWLM